MEKQQKLNQEPDIMPEKGKQAKLVDSLQAKPQNKVGEYQPHNARKEPLGPNTKR